MENKGVCVCVCVCVWVWVGESVYLGSMYIHPFRSDGGSKVWFEFGWRKGGGPVMYAQ